MPMGARMRGYLQLAIFITIFAGAAHAADDDIFFSRKVFSDAGDEVSIAGTVTGEGIGYPNNSTRITCIRARNECAVVSVEQIGFNQIGSIQIPFYLPITRWTDQEIIAGEMPPFAGCERTTIFITRKTQTVLWVQEPANQGYAFCEHSDSRVQRWTVEDSPGAKRFSVK
jgi:hypothetical protein